jgi:hypothetical protein
MIVFDFSLNLSFNLRSHAFFRNSRHALIYRLALPFDKIANAILLTVSVNLTKAIGCQLDEVQHSLFPAFQRD